MRDGERHLTDAELALLAEHSAQDGRDRRLRQHLSECGECRAKLEATQAPLQEFFALHRQVLTEAIPPAEPARGRLRDALAWAAGESAARGAWAPLRLSAALAATALALVAGTAALLWYFGPAPPSGSSAATLGALPDPRLTPGRTSSASLADLCAEDEPTAPAVDRQTALRVFRDHGIEDPGPMEYELDHLVPPELGGVTAPENLWPQAYDGSNWNANAKDALEDRLRHMACSGQIPLRSAQADIARDWVAAYKKHFRADEPLVEHAAFLKDQPWE